MAYNMLDSLRRGQAGGVPGAGQTARESQGGLKYISVRDLVPSDDNFYSMAQIEELAAAIELAGKVLQNLTVTPIQDGKYKIIAGHRRRLAVLSLLNHGKAQYEQLPCVVEAPEEDEQAQALRDAILLIAANSQREKTDWDKVEEARRMRSLLEQLSKRKRVPGDKRQIIAQALNTTPAQVGRYDAIAKRLIPELQEEMKSERLGVSAAYELSALPAEEQHRVYTESRKTGELRYTEAKQAKWSAKAKEDEQAQARPVSSPAPERAEASPPAPSERIAAQSEIPTTKRDSRPDDRPLHLTAAPMRTCPHCGKPLPDTWTTNK